MEGTTNTPYYIKILLYAITYSSYSKETLGDFLLERIDDGQQTIGKLCGAP